MVFSGWGAGIGRKRRLHFAKKVLLKNEKDLFVFSDDGVRPVCRADTECPGEVTL